MEEKILETAGAVYHYTISDSKASITGYEGKRSELFLPSHIEGVPIKSIEKKVFFNKSGLCRIYLPETIESIGDWAFSHCKDLEEIYLKRKDYALGKALFGECPRLSCICLSDEEKIEPDMALSPEEKGFGTLLAAVCGILDAPYLFQTVSIDDPEWLSLWDARMMTVLSQDDMEGYTKLLLCGEEDYGSRENNLDFFLEQKRRRKVRLAFLRLLHDKELASDNKRILTEYLLSHTKGKESEETWLVLKEEHGEDMVYLSLFADLGCVSLENISDILTDLGDTNPQMKAYFMRYKEEYLGTVDFFAGLSLD